MSLKSIAFAFCPSLWNRLWHVLSDSRQGVKDVIVSAIPQLVGVVTGFFGSVLIARGLGPTGMGQYALIMSLAGVATVLSDLGIGQTSIRYASRAAAIEDISTQMSVLRWSLRWRLSLVFLITTLFFLIAPYIARMWHSEALIPYLRLGLLGGIFAALASVPTIYYQSIKRFATNASVTSAQRIISFAGILALSVFSLWSLLNLVIVNLVASAIGAFAFLVLVPKAALWPQDVMRTLKGLSLRRIFASPDIRHGINNGLDASSPAGFLRFQMLSTIIVMATMQTDVWMMGYFLDESKIGVYSVAARFTLPLAIALGALNTALWPRASGITCPQHLMRLLKKTLGISVLAALTMSVYSVFAPILAPVIFGVEYEKSCLLGQLLCLRYCLATLICPIGVIGYSYGFVRVYWLINLIQLFSVLVINMMFLPKIGALASTIALIINEIIGVVCIGWLVLWRITRDRMRTQKGNSYEYD
ncbi:MAG: oligosaccharide flippase family protein [Kiritimatiellia bacterium]